MTSFLFYFILIAGSYLIGSIPFGFLIGKCFGKDIRTLGSCNIGATNVTRCVGPTAGKVCFFLDAAKGFVPVFIANLLLHQHPEWDPTNAAPLFALAATTLGHMFTCFLKCRGGKGVSTAAGGVLALAPIALIAGLVVWVIVFLKWRYVSLASIIAAAMTPFFATILQLVKVDPWNPVVLTALYILALAAILKHTSNVKRLLNGTENRFSKPARTKEK